jgi:protein gp37
MSATKIEWCDLTINPVVGCSHCSPGCDNCYAERFAARLARHPHPKICVKYAGVVDEQGKWTGNLVCDLDVFDTLPRPRRRSKKQCRVFVGSMTDMFHENGMSSGDLALLWAIMDSRPHLTFCLLTKRAGRMKELCEAKNPPENVWLGVTVCNQYEADEKIPILFQTPAAKRFVSVEPMLAPVEIGKYLYGSYECALSCGTRLPCTALLEMRCTKCGFTGPDDYETWGNGDCAECPKCHQDGCCGEIEEICPDCGTYMVREHPDTPYLDWVIAGPETGPKARAADEAWFRSLRDQCHADYRKTPFFLKKNADGTRLLDGREWNEVPGRYEK